MQRGPRRSSRLKQSLLEERGLLQRRKRRERQRNQRQRTKRRKLHATNDTRVHSSHIEEQLENVGENQDDGRQSNLGLHADHAAVSEILYRR